MSRNSHFLFLLLWLSSSAMVVADVNSTNGTINFDTTKDSNPEMVLNNSGLSVSANLTVLKEQLLSGNLVVSGSANINGFLYPVIDGAAGQVLVTNGSKSLSFASLSATSADLTLSNLSDYDAARNNLIGLGNLQADFIELATGKVLVGNASGNAAAVDLTGAFVITQAGVATLEANSVASANIVDGSILDIDLAGNISPNKIAGTAATLAGSETLSNKVIVSPIFTGSPYFGIGNIQSSSLSIGDGKLLIGNSSGNAAEVNLSGALTVDNAGVALLGIDAVASANILDGSIADADLAGGIAPTKIAGTAVTLSGVEVLSNKTIESPTFTGTPYFGLGNIQASSLALNNGQVFVGNSSGNGAAVTLGGAFTINNSGTATMAADSIASSNIVDGSVADVDLAGGISPSKISGTAVTLNGTEILTNKTIDSPTFTGTPYFGLGNIQASSLALDNGNIFVGDASGNGSSVSLSGAFTINNSGVATMALNSVTSANVVDGSIADADLAGGISPNKISGTAVTLNGTETLTNKTIDSPTFTGTPYFGLGNIQASSLALDNGNIFVGDASGNGSSVSLSGAFTINNSGVATMALNSVASANIVDGSVADADLAGGISPSKISGTAVTLNGTEILTNKTIDSPTFTGTPYFGLGNIQASSLALDNGQIIVGDASGNGTSVSLSGAFTINNSGVATMALNSVTSANIVDGSVADADLAGGISPSKITGTAATLNGTETLTNKTIDSPTFTGTPYFGLGNIQASSLALDNGQIFVGDASGNGSSVSLSGAFTINNSGVATMALNSVTSANIVDGSVADADLAGGISPSKITGTAATLNGTETLTNKTIDSPTFTGTPYFGLGNIQASSLGLDNGQIIVGDASGNGSAVSLSGAFTINNSGVATMALNSVTSANIVDGSVADADLAGGISPSKITGTAATLNGTETLTNKTIDSPTFTGTPYFGLGNIQASSLGLDNGQIIVGDASGNGSAVSLSGAFTINNSGVATMALNSVTSANIVDGSVADADLAGGISPSKITGTAATLNGTETLTNKTIDSPTFTGTPYFGLGNIQASSLGLDNGQIIVGDASGNGSAVSLSGAFTINNSGVATMALNSVTSANIVDGSVADADLAGGISPSKITGTAATLNGTETLTNKTIDSPTFTGTPYFGLGNIQASSLALDNGQIFVGDASGNGSAVSLSGAFTINNSGVATMALNSVTSANIVDGSVADADLAGGISPSKITGTAATLNGTETLTNKTIDSPTFTGTPYFGLGNIHASSLALDNGQIFVGDASGNGSAVSLSGAFTINNSGVATMALNSVTSANIVDGSVTDTDLAGGISPSKITGTAATLNGTETLTNKTIDSPTFTGTPYFGLGNIQASSLALDNGQIFVGDASGNGSAVSLSGAFTINNSGVATMALNSVTSANIVDGSVTDTDLAGGISPSKITGTAATLNGTETLTNKTIDSPTFTGTPYFGLGNIQASSLALDNGQIFVGDASGNGSAVSLSGAFTINNSGVAIMALNSVTSANIVDGSVADADLAGGISPSKITGTAATLNGTETLTNKTIDSPTFTGTPYFGLGNIQASSLALDNGQIFVGDASGNGSAVSLSGAFTINNSGVATMALNSVTSANIVDGSVADADLAGSISPSKISGTAVTLAGAETLTNKTIDSPTFTGTPYFGLGNIQASSLALDNGQIFVGDASGNGSAVSLSGAFTINNSGVATMALNSVTSANIVDGSVADADLAGSISPSKISGTAVTLAGAETLTNKTIDSPTFTGTPYFGLGNIQASSLALDNGQIFVGDASGNGSAVSLSGAFTINNSGVATMALNSVTSANIVDGSVADADLAGGINPNKITGTAATLTGTETLTNKTIDSPTFTGTPYFGLGNIQASSLALDNGQIFVGDASGNGSAVSLSGAFTINNSGVATMALNSVTSANIVDGSVADADLAGSISPSKISGTAATIGGTETLTNKTLTSPTITDPTMTGDLTMSGNVYAETIGVATSNPSANLHVTGTTQLDGEVTIDTSGTGHLTIGDGLTMSSNTYGMKLAGYHNTYGIGVQPAILEFITINSAADFRWGTGTSGSLSEVMFLDAGTKTLQVDNITVDKAMIINNGGLANDTQIKGFLDDNLFYVDASEDFIGIGKATPGYKLDVVGAIGASGNINTSTNLLIPNHDGANTGLILGGTLVTSTAAELNILDGVTASASDLNALDGVMAGIGSAGNALVLNSDQSVTAGFKNLTLTGNLVLSGTVDGLDLSTLIDQDVRTTASPSFAGLTVDAAGAGSMVFGDGITSNSSTMGMKLAAWGSTYGLGIQANLLEIITHSSNADVRWGHGASGSLTEVMFLDSGTQTLSVNNLTLDRALIVNNAAADVDAQFKGDTDNNLLYVDASTDRIGIGTNTPGTKLDVSGAITGSGILSIDDTTETTSVTTGSIHTDGGLGVAKSIFAGANLDLTGHGTAASGLKLAGTLVTSTAAELNVLDGMTSSTAELNILTGVTATAAELNALASFTGNTTELNYLDGVVPGTAAASKALVLDSSSDISGINAMTLTGAITVDDTTESTSSVTGSIQTDGGLGVVKDVRVGGSVIVSDNISTSANLHISGHDGTSTGLFLNGTLVRSTAAELNILDGVTSTAAELNILDGVTATASELNILDGVTASAADLNVLDGVSAGAGSAGNAVVLNTDQSVTSGFKNLTLTGNITVNDQMLSSDGTISLGANIISTGNMLHDLGSLTNSFRYIYSQHIVLTSDERKKTDVQDLNYGLEEVMKLRPVSYKWKHEEGSDRRALGLIAQDVEEVIEENVHVQNDAEKSMGVDYISMVPVLIKAIQEQNEMLKKQEAEIKALKEQISIGR